MAKPVAPPTNVYTDPPRKHVMLLSCMDQRLLDDTVRFMNGLNLQNRYDQVIFAGAALGAAKLSSPLFGKETTTKSKTKTPPKLEWKQVFFDQLVAAIDGLERKIHDIFILDHMDCGAYRKLYPLDGDPHIREKYERCRTAAEWMPFHAPVVKGFALEVVEFCKAHSSEKPWNDMQVWSLLMDLRGSVVTLGCDATY
jgi:hypothetical protein